MCAIQQTLIILKNSKCSWLLSNYLGLIFINDIDVCNKYFIFVMCFVCFLLWLVMCFIAIINVTYERQGILWGIEKKSCEISLFSACLLLYRMQERIGLNNQQSLCLTQPHRHEGYLLMLLLVVIMVLTVLKTLYYLGCRFMISFN